jgi:hypothetical protein
MNKVIHGMIAVFFGIACWFLWAMLTVVSNLMLRVSDQPPAFTQLVVDLKPLLVLLPFLVIGYCFFVWLRRSANTPDWVGFFAGTMMGLVLIMLPTMVAIWLPMVQFMDQALIK